MLLSALNAIDEPVFLIKPDGTIIEANDAFLQLLQVPRDECIGQQLELFIANMDRQKFREDMQLVLSKETIKSQIKAMRRDRSTFSAEINASPMRDESGNPQAIIGTIRDVTHRVAVQEQIAKTTMELTALMKSSTEIIRTTDLHQRLKAIAQAIQGLGWRRVLITLTDENLETTDIVSAGLTPEEEEYLWENRQPGHVWRQRLGPTFDRFKLGEFYYLPWSDPFVRNHFKTGTVNSRIPKEEMVDWDPQDLLYASLRLPEGNVVGRISIDDPLDGRRPTRESLAPLGLFVHQAAVAIENAYLIRDLETARNQVKDYADQLEIKVEERTLDLRRSEEKLRSIFAASPNPIMLIDLNGKIIECNQAALDMHEYSSREELLGKNGLELATKRDRQRAMEYLKKTLELGSLKNIEYTSLTQDGREFPVEVSASVVRDALGNPTSFVAITQNITERKRAEEALRESEERYRSVVDNVGIGVSVISPKMEILTLNNQMKKWFTDIDVSQKPICYRVFYRPPQDKACLYCPVCRTLKDGQVHEATTDGSTDSGRDYRIVSSPIKGKDGKIIAAIELVEDITDRRRMEQQLLKSERLAAIGELATMVGHDLRNPLTGINGAAYYLKMKLDLKMNKKTREMLELIEKDIQYSNKIINDLLDFSRDIRLAKAKISITSLIKETLAKMEIPRKVKIIDLTKKDHKVLVDAVQMNRVFENVVKNAIDAMPRGGKLEIKSERVKNLLKVTFCDTGVGISQENLSRLGSPLFTTKAKGVGMGLAICKRLTEAHGGSLSIESKDKAGTCVTVALPIEVAEKPEETAGGR
jgi:two-component system NtrC family sensor kinase